jgi:hypothetical protein
VKGLFGVLLTAIVVLFGGIYAWNQMRRVPLVATAQPQVAENPIYGEAQEAQKTVAFTGPLADYVSRRQGSPEAKEAETVVTLQVVPLKPSASDHVGGSVVGTSMPILQTTFRIRRAVQVPFEVPAHAASPRLKGSYRSFRKMAGVRNDDAGAEIALLVLNDQQFNDFLNGGAGEAAFAADDARQQEVNTGLPPTMNQAQNYHLLFLNNSKGKEEKFVQADFRMEF